MATKKTTLKKLAHEASVKREVDTLFEDNNDMGSNAGEVINTILCEHLTARECKAIVLKVSTNKIKSVVEVNVNKGARVWETRHVVYDPRDESERAIASEKTQGAAIKKARAYTEKHQKRTIIQLEKVLVKGSTNIATISYKSSKTETKGKYLFIVAAPE